MCESPIALDTLLITDTGSGVKRRVPKLLMECSMRKLHNELISSPYDGGLLGGRHADTNDAIFSDTMIFSLEPPQLRPMAYHQKMMCACAICNSSEYFKESLNTLRLEESKITIYRADNSRLQIIC